MPLKPRFQSKKVQRLPEREDMTLCILAACDPARFADSKALVSYATFLSPQISLENQGLGSGQVPALNWNWNWNCLKRDRNLRHLRLLAVQSAL